MSLKLQRSKLRDFTLQIYTVDLMTRVFLFEHPTFNLQIFVFSQFAPIAVNGNV